jgi:molybdenum cofactor cytidylyltransferase
MINAIVLAAGESKRMGMPKPLLRFPRSMGVPPMDCESRARCPCYGSDDTTFLEQIVSVLRRSEVGRITVVLGAQAPRVVAATDLSGVGVVINENYGEGQLSSLTAGLKSVPSKTEAILLCLVDNPLITAESADGVVGAFRISGKPIVIPVFEGRRGHPTLFARPMFDELLHAPADQGARYVVQANGDRVFEVTTRDPGILARIDTPEDYLSHFGTAPRIMER